MPPWACLKKNQPDYRYLAIREEMQTPEKIKDLKALPFQTMESEELTYKLFGVVTNRTLEGNALIQWHRERCGKSEQVHHTQKEGLAGGQMPSNFFGANAAWWQSL